MQNSSTLFQNLSAGIYFALHKLQKYILVFHAIGAVFIGATLT